MLNDKFYLPTSVEVIMSECESILMKVILIRTWVLSKTFRKNYTEVGSLIEKGTNF